MYFPSSQTSGNMDLKILKNINAKRKSEMKEIKSYLSRFCIFLGMINLQISTIPAPLQHLTGYRYILLGCEHGLIFISVTLSQAAPSPPLI